MPTCPRCTRDLGLHEGSPHVTDGGAVELWHAGCWQTRYARGVEEVAIVAPQRRSRGRWIAGGVAASAIAALSIARWASAGTTRPSVAAVDLDPVVDEVAPRVRFLAPPETRPHPELHAAKRVVDPETRYPVPLDGGVPLDEKFPSLREWAHPVTDSPELMPDQPSRHFGAERIGVTRTECGAGHCGVDLDGPRGRPIVAVADGVVVRVEHHELGLDGRSGRYVRIEHVDGTLTAYMHLDDIAEGLEVGDHVEAGQMIGTLGATAVYASVPHLHFSLEVPNHPGSHGDHTDTHYVDPAPFLVRSTILNAPDRRHATKPAM